MTKKARNGSPAAFCRARALSRPRRLRPASRSTPSAAARRTARPPGEPASAKVRWGLLIDLNKCPPGCNACVTACNGLQRLAKHRARPEIDPQWIRKVTLKDPNTGVDAFGAGHVPALRKAALRRRLPDRRLVQARRRHRAGGQAHLHRLPLLHDGLPFKARSFVHEAHDDQKTNAPRGKGTVEGCTLCVDRIDAGRRGPPASRPAPRKAAR